MLLFFPSRNTQENRFFDILEVVSLPTVSTLLRLSFHVFYQTPYMCIFIHASYQWLFFLRLFYPRLHISYTFVVFVWVLGALQLVIFRNPLPRLSYVNPSTPITTGGCWFTIHLGIWAQKIPAKRSCTKCLSWNSCVSSHLSLSHQLPESI